MSKDTEHAFMEYFKVIIKDKNQDVKKWAVYNLPCYFFHFRNSSEENVQLFDQVYRELCTLPALTVSGGDD